MGSNDIIQQITDMYYGADDPKGWVVGSAILDKLDKYFKVDAFYKDSQIKQETLMGLDYIEDTKNKDRLEIVE